MTPLIRCNECRHRGAFGYCVNPKARSLTGDFVKLSVARFGGYDPNVLPEGPCGVAAAWFESPPPPPPSLWARLRRWLTK